MTATIDPNARLSRRDVADALTAAGFPIAPATLATYATRGGGPAYITFNSRVLYRWSDALAWAEARAGAPRATAAEHRASETAAA